MQQNMHRWRWSLQESQLKYTFKTWVCASQKIFLIDCVLAFLALPGITYIGVCTCYWGKGIRFASRGCKSLEEIRHREIEVQLMQQLSLCPFDVPPFVSKFFSCRISMNTRSLPSSFPYVRYTFPCSKLGMFFNPEKNMRGRILLTHHWMMDWLELDGRSDVSVAEFTGGMYTCVCLHSHSVSENRNRTLLLEVKEALVYSWQDMVMCLFYRFSWWLLVLIWLSSSRRRSDKCLLASKSLLIRDLDRLQVWRYASVRGSTYYSRFESQGVNKCPFSCCWRCSITFRLWCLDACLATRISEGVFPLGFHDPMTLHESHDMNVFLNPSSSLGNRDRLGT